MELIEDIMVNYPKDWKELNLGKSSILKARIGWQGLTTAEYLDNGEYFLITGTDFKNGFIDWDNCVFVEKERYDQDKYIQIVEDDILVTKDGTIGKVALVKDVPKPTTLNSGVFVIRPVGNSYYPQYFYHILMSEHFRDFLGKLSAGSTISHLYQKDFIHYNFPAPPTKEEQKSIATALTDVDELITGLEKIISKKKDIKQGAMQELLTPRDDWKKYKIDEISIVGRGRVISHKEINSSKNKIYPVYSSQTANNGIMGFIDTYDFDGEYVTWTTDGENAGTVFHRNGKFNCTNVCGTIKLKDCFDGKFISYALSRTTCKHVSRNLANPKLMNGPMKKITIFIPNLNQQKNIANIISDLEEEISQLETKKEKYQAIKQGMMQELLTGKTRLV